MKKPKHLNFMNEVRARDNWTCQKCGSVEYPQAHHIDSVKDYPLFQNLPNNGLTLCVYCHADAHPEIPRGLFISKVIQAEKEGCISAGKLAKELQVNPRTVVRKAIKLGILKPMQKWMFTNDEVELIRQHSRPKGKKVKEVREKKVKDKMVLISIIFSNEQYNWLKKIKKQRMQSISAILRGFVSKEMNNERTQISHLGRTATGNELSGNEL